MINLIRPILGAAMLFAVTGAASAADRTIVILDASGSMWGQVDGKPKLMIARETLHAVLPTLPADAEIGLMAYGHRDKGSCEDIQLIVPPAPGTANAITTAADNLKFLGKTPLTAAVKQAAEDLKYTEDKATVVLITDGLETCGGDPCALGKELEASGIDFKVDVVGFGLTAEEGRQVACLAEDTGGKYIQANDEEGLKSALVTTIVAQPEPAPAPEPQPAPAPEPVAPEFNFTPTLLLAEGGEPVTSGSIWEIYKANADGSQGEYVTTEYDEHKGNLEPGGYVVVARVGEARTSQNLTVEAGKVYAPVFIANAGTLIIHPRSSEGAPVDTGARVDFEYPGGSYTGYGDSTAVLPAGVQKVVVTIGKGSVAETIQLAAGQKVEKDVVVGVGHVLANAYYTAGGDKVDSGSLAFQVVRAKKAIDGSREDMGTNYGAGSEFYLPAGDYALIATLDKAVAETPFSMSAGASISLDVNLDAGVLAVSAPGAYQIQVVSAKKDIQGNRKDFGNAYSETHQTTLPPGEYTVVVTMPDNAGTKEAPATVKAGERTEVTVP